MSLAFVFPGQEAAEELVPFEGVPRAKPESLDWESLDDRGPLCFGRFAALRYLGPVPDGERLLKRIGGFSQGRVPSREVGARPLAGVALAVLGGKTPVARRRAGDTSAS